MRRAEYSKLKPLRTHAGFQPGTVPNGSTLQMEYAGIEPAIAIPLANPPARRDTPNGADPVRLHEGLVSRDLGAQVGVKQKAEYLKLNPRRDRTVFETGLAPWPIYLLCGEQSTRNSAACAATLFSKQVRILSDLLSNYYVDYLLISKPMRVRALTTVLTVPRSKSLACSESCSYGTISSSPVSSLRLLTPAAVLASIHVAWTCDDTFSIRSFSSSFVMTYISNLISRKLRTLEEALIAVL